MIEFFGHRRTAVMLFGLIALLVTVAQPPWARSDVSSCLEPWREACLISGANCVDCNHWCSVVVGEHCVEEWSTCKLAEEGEPCHGDDHPDHPYLEECWCKYGGSGGGWDPL
jgi:hypothetical protein